MKHLARLALGTAVLLPLLAAPARAQDLLAVWRAAAGHDQRLAVAHAEHGVSQTLRAQAAALWRPSVSLSLAAGAGMQESALRGARFSAPGMGTIDDARFVSLVNGGLATRVAVTAQQPLVNAARDARQAELHGAADAGDTAWRAAQSELMLRTAERYFALALAEERVRVVARQIESVALARREAHDRYRIGDAPVTDTHEADAALAGARARHSAAELDARVQRDQLAGSTGLAAPGVRLPAALPAPVPDQPAWLLAAEADNPRLRGLAQAVGVAEQRLRQREAAGRPTLDLVAQAAHQRVGDGSARSRGVDALLGVQLNIPLSTGGMQQAQAREAAGRVDQARAELELAREEVRQQVRAAWLGLQAGAARIDALRESLAASGARLDSTRLGLAVGDRATLDVLNAENDLAQAELALAQARADQVLTHLRLAALAGRLDETLLAPY